MMSLSSQKKAESERLIISYLDNSFIAYTWKKDVLIVIKAPAEGGGVEYGEA